jgi:photosystem II stability/assembly factor-like uncharacterized protein
MKTMISLLCLISMAFGLSAQNWENQESGSEEWLTSIAFTHPDTGFIAGLKGTFLKTVNGGELWETVNLYTSENLYSVNFPSPKVGYISGANVILKTKDYGRNWEFLDNIPAAGYYYDCEFLNDTVGFISANEGLAMKTMDGGLSWQILPTETEENLYTIQFLSDSIGYFSGHPGILKTIDTGNSWELVSNEFEERLMYAHFINEEMAYALGLNGFAAISKDSAETWERINFPGEITDHLYEIAFVSENEFYIIGTKGLIYKSIDSGLNWAVDSSYTDVILRDILIVEDRVYIVGGDGIILFKDLNKTLVQTHRSDPIQLYPNPVDDQLFVNGVEGEAFYKIISISGKRVKSGLFQGKGIDLRDLDSGSYVLILSTKNETIQRIILKN